MCICLLVLWLLLNFYNEPSRTMHVQDIAQHAKNVIRYWNYRLNSHIRLYWKNKWDEARVSDTTPVGWQWRIQSNFLSTLHTVDNQMKNDEHFA